MAAIHRAEFEQVTDIHYGLSSARVQVCQPDTVDEIIGLIHRTSQQGLSIATCRGRHAMGGQQFADGAQLLDLRKMNRVLEFDSDRGMVRVQAGGQLYKSDTHQLSEYLEHYHSDVDRITNARYAGSELITELYVPPEHSSEFLHAAAALLIDRSAQVIYGTIRVIQPDVETVMTWCRRRFAWVIFNLHIDHQDTAIARAADTFRALIDLASDLGGSYFLTYHRFATPQQLERCYPRVREFFNMKRQFDPDELFQSDWYRHYRPHFTDQQR